MTPRDRVAGPARSAWPDTTRLPAPRENLYQSATWLLGRHPRLARLVDRVRGVVQPDEDDGGLFLDLDHLAEVIAAVPTHTAAWADYEHRNRPPANETAYERWCNAGPCPDAIVPGLADFLVMSSGETVSLRLLATLAALPVPFRVGDLCSLDAEGHRLLTDWTAVVQAA